MIIIYRTSNNGYQKDKPTYVNNKNCLDNFINNFDKPDLIIADNVNDDYYKELLTYDINIDRTSLGSGAQSFKYMLDLLVNSNFKDDEIVYMIENDYIHKPNSKQVVQDCFITLNPDYLTLYDHPDKYINGTEGGNPYVESFGEITRLVRSNYCHWKMCNSTTMSFAARLKTLKEDYDTISNYIQGTYPDDFKMFIDLINNKDRVLLSSVPGYSTHGETKWLSPFTNWREICLGK